MHTVATFVEAFPSFSVLATETVQAALDAAEAEIDVDVYGDQATYAHGVYTADRLAISPHGAQAQLIAKDGHSIWWLECERVRKLVGGSYRLVLP